MTASSTSFFGSLPLRLVGAKQHASSLHVDPVLARCASDSHLARVKRMSSQGYPDLLEGSANGNTTNHI
jgi:hypothetical protein